MKWLSGLLNDHGVAVWCAGCQQHVSQRQWNQDYYLCGRCSLQVPRLIRAWATGKILRDDPLARFMLRMYQCPTLPAGRAGLPPRRLDTVHRKGIRA